MAFFPVVLQLEHQPVIVFGGGAVAERKVKSLLDAGAEVTVVAPQLTKNLETWVKSRKIKHRQRAYRRGDLRGFNLVFAATSDEPANARIAREAGEKGLWVNVADRPELCSFILPAVLSRGDLTVAVSTAGKSPALAKKIREDLETLFGAEYGEYLRMIAQARQRARAEIPEQDRREQLLETLLNSDLLKWLRQGELTKAQLFIEEVLKEASAPPGVDS